MVKMIATFESIAVKEIPNLNKMIDNLGGKAMFVPALSTDKQIKPCCQASIWFKNHGLNVPICVICGEDL